MRVVAAGAEFTGDLGDVKWQPRVPSSSLWRPTTVYNWVFVDRDGYGYGAPSSTARAPAGYGRYQCGSARYQLESVKWVFTGFNPAADGDAITAMRGNRKLVSGPDGAQREVYVYVLDTSGPLGDPDDRTCTVRRSTVHVRGRYYTSRRLQTADGGACSGMFYISVPAVDCDTITNRSITARIEAVWEVVYSPHRSTGERSTTRTYTARSDNMNIRVATGCKLPVG